MGDELDSIVKGAPMPGKEVPKNVSTTSPISTSATAKLGDPLSHTPSSPSMIYLNLLILEASLRTQYLELRARRRHHTFFLTLLIFWIAGFGYLLFLNPREDGRGVGGSVYWVVEVLQKVCFLGGVITAILVWGTGIWERGVRWPRRWFAVSNRGLRGFNCKLVIIKRPWYAEALATTGWFLTYGLFSNSGGSSYRYVDPSILREVDKQLDLSSTNHPTLPIVSEDEERGGHEEDLAPGGDYVKLLLMAKPFSATFRENWEIYRAEYWEKENERRALLRAKVKERDRHLLKQHGGWFWWLPWRKSVLDKPPPARAEAEKVHPHPRRTAIEHEHRRTRSSSMRRGSMSLSGTSSRSPTPTIEQEDGSTVARKASTASNASDKRRKKVVSSSSSGASSAGAGPRPARMPRPAVESRSVTPETHSPLVHESSFSSVASSGSSGAETARSLRPSSRGSGSSSLREGA